MTLEIMKPPLSGLLHSGDDTAANFITPKHFRYFKAAFAHFDLPGGITRGASCFAILISEVTFAVTGVAVNQNKRGHLQHPPCNPHSSFDGGMQADTFKVSVENFPTHAEVLRDSTHRLITALSFISFEAVGPIAFAADFAEGDRLHLESPKNGISKGF